MAQQLAIDVRTLLPGAEPLRAKVDSGFIDFYASGSGAATRKLLDQVNAVPELRAALDGNPAIPHKALNNLKRDEEFAKKFGLTNEAIQSARRIIGSGPGWIGRLEDGLKNGVILPVVAAWIFAPVLPVREPSPQASTPTEDPAGR